MTSERIAIGRRQLGLLGAGLAAAGLRAVPGTMPEAAAAPALDAGGPIKVGILHSLSGTMAISETTLKDVMLMLVAEQNAKGGLLGRKLEPVVVDPASNWPLFAEKARALLSVDKVAAVFGCWTSVSRKSVLPVFEELNGLLYYPVQYEGEELSQNVFYTGAAPNQQAIPAVEYLMSKEGGGATRFFLLGTDYVYPRTTNKILRAFLKSKGVAAKDIEEIKPYFEEIDSCPYGLWTDGLELFQAIRFAPEHPPAGVIVLTEAGDVPTRERAQQLGAAAVLVKPIRGDELIDVVEDLLTFI